MTLSLFGSAPLVCAFPWGAPESTCATGVLPVSHGPLSTSANPPFTARLYTTYTDVDVSDVGWSTGLNYDFELSTDSEYLYGIGGYLVHDLTSPAGFTSLHADLSESDHIGTPQKFLPLPSQLRCDGSGVTHTSTNGNTTVSSLSTLRFTVRAPDVTAGNTWSFRLSIVTLPINEAGSVSMTPYSTWPGTIATNQGRSFLFEKTFPRLVSPPASPTGDSTVTCSIASLLDTCIRPGTAEQQCFSDQSVRQCNIAHMDTALVLKDVGDDDDILLGGQDQILRVDSSFQTVKAIKFTGSGMSRVLDMVTVNGTSMLLTCATGYGRPVCHFRNPSTLALDDKANVWIATGAIPRTAEAQHGLLVTNGSLYSANYQVPVVDGGGVAANVISRSLITSASVASGQWEYQYNEPITTPVSSLLLPAIF